MPTSDLRKSILKYAMEGKLVKQDSNDEPASVLLDKIKQEKEKLVKEGKIKKSKNESTIYKGDDGHYYEKVGNKENDITEEIPFEIPNSWSYVRLRNISEIFAGGTPLRTKKDYWQNGTIPWLKIQDLTSSKKFVNKSSEFITQKGLENSSAKMIEKGAILYTIFATIGEVRILDFEACSNQAIAAIIPYDNDIKDYLYYYLTNLQGTIKISGHGLAQQNINQTILSNAIISIPPLAEQKRIVNAIIELEPLFDEYEKLMEESENLNNDFSENLRKSILKYAMEGKLVKQDSNDEPASVLLDKIKQEKEKLVKEGKIKKGKNESTIYKGDDGHYYEKVGNKENDITEEIPFEIPNSWSYVQFKHVVYFNLGATPNRKIKKYWSNGTIPWVSISDMEENGHIDRTKECITEDAIRDKFSNKLCNPGTLIMSFKLTIGKTSIVDMKCGHNEAIISIYPYYDCNNIVRDYLFKFLPLLTKYVKKTGAIKGDTLNSKIIADMLIPVPPLAEQKRIVDKIDQIFEILN